MGARHAIEALRARGLAGAQADFGQVTAALGAAVDALAAKLGAINAALAAWAGSTPFLTMRRTLREIGLCAGAGQAVPGAAGAIDLNDPALAQDVLTQDLSRIRALYTMRAERDLHDSLFCPARSA